MQLTCEDYFDEESFLQILLKNNIISNMQEECLYMHFAHKLLRLAFFIDKGSWLHLANLLIRYINNNADIKKDDDARMALAMLSCPKTVLKKLLES